MPVLSLSRWEGNGSREKGFKRERDPEQRIRITAGPGGTLLGQGLKSSGVRSLDRRLLFMETCVAELGALWSQWSNLIPPPPPPQQPKSSHRKQRGTYPLHPRNCMCVLHYLGKNWQIVYGCQIQAGQNLRPGRENVLMRWDGTHGRHVICCSSTDHLGRGPPELYGPCDLPPTPPTTIHHGWALSVVHIWAPDMDFRLLSGLRISVCIGCGVV